MAIQLISYKKLQSNDLTCVSFRTALAFDLFELNIIDLSNPNIWQKKSNDVYSYVDCEDDLKMLGKMTENSKSKIIVLLPQDCEYEYDYRFGEFHIKTLLSRDTEIVCNAIKHLIKKNIEIEYERNLIKVGDKDIFKADFHFILSDNFKSVLTSFKTNRCLVCNDDRFFFVDYNARQRKRD